MIDLREPGPNPAVAWSMRSRRSGRHPHTTERGLRLAAEEEWLLTADEGILDQVADALSGYAERLGERSLLLSFGNAVGRIQLPHLGQVDISSHKWGEDAFNSMLADLIKSIASLPFSAGQNPGLQFQLSGGGRSRVIYHAFVYLRHVMSSAAPREQRLVPSLELITRDPNRRWARETRRVPLESMATGDPAGVVALLTSRMHRVDQGRLEGRGHLATLAERLGGYLPTTVVESTVREELDTPENRFIKSFLDQALRIAAAAERLALERGGAFGDRLTADARRCAARLAQVRKNPVWAVVGESTQLPLSSTVLRNRRGYREVLGHWVRLRRTADLPLDTNQATALLESKDIALLYELWCYFQVVEVVQAILGPPQRISRPKVTPAEVSVEHEFAAEWDGVRVSYNARFRRSASRQTRRAYSTPLRPDIVIEDHRNNRVHVLDAKFRVQPSHDPDGADDGLSFKRADLHKMHAYRDALPLAASAWVLYPGTDFKWYPAPASAAGDGVGAIPLDPVAGSAHLARVIRSIVQPVSASGLRDGQ